MVGHVVVEVPVDVEARGAPRADALGPRAQHRIGVIRCVQPLRTVEADVDELSGDRVDARPLRRVDEAERDVVLAEEVERLRGEPRCVARLEGVPPPAPADEREIRIEPLRVELPLRRELDEDHARLPAEPGERTLLRDREVEPGRRRAADVGHRVIHRSDLVADRIAVDLLAVRLEPARVAVREDRRRAEHLDRVVDLDPPVVERE